MNRREFLTRTVAVPAVDKGKTANKYQNKKLPYFKSGFAGLTEYAGPFQSLQLKHLLNRSLFGFSRSQYDALIGKSMNEVVTILLTEPAVPAPPLNNYYQEISDSSCSPGVTWVDKGYNDLTNTKRIFSLKDWWLQQIVNQPVSLQEKMVMFWHNHFSTETSTVINAQLLYKHNALLRSSAFGNFKSLTKAITLDPAMLVYLNGYKNQKNKPDENYARELQELFTLGKGPDSQYTESDVIAAARILTGYQIDLATESFTFNPNLHDTGNKQFSAFYNNQVIAGKSGTAGMDELDELLNMIFAQQEVARHLCRELYRYFVYYVITDEVEENVITPLAEIFRDGNYEIQPVLETLFKSEHFYDIYNVGCVIKNPIDFTASALKNFQIALPSKSDPALYYTAFRGVNIYNALTGMDPGDPPNVAGWEAYWSSPVFHEFWINSVTLPYRNGLSELLISPVGYKYRGVVLKVDVVQFTLDIPNADDPNLLIDYLIDSFMSLGIAEANFNSLKSILLSNQLEDHYWTDAWNAYKVNPTQLNYNIVYSRLYPFYKSLLHLAEYQLI